MEESGEYMQAAVVEKRRTKPPIIKEQHLAYAVMRAEGLTPTKAAQAIGLSRTSGYNLEKNLDIYEQQKGRLLKDSVRSLSKLVKGEPVGQVTNVKDSTVLAACQVVLDREKPKVNLSQNINLNLDFLPIALEDYL